MILQQLHQDLNATTLYAYGTSQATAQYPGPTLIATQFETALIRWENHIPDAQHFLTVDPTIHWANPVNGGVPTVVHVHGAEVQSVYDGYPDAWFTPLNETGPEFVTQNYQYPNTQPPTMLWYHDHTDGITRLNVLAGLVGLYFVRSSFDAAMTALGFPSGQYEIPLVIRDMQFWPNGSINFPNIGDNATIHPSWCPEYFGDTILVNGNAWPYLTVYPRVYRFRILNGANARFFQVRGYENCEDPETSSLIHDVYMEPVTSLALLD
jgi:FtsP/CotA-like multicopper oxidase with cupredoxin domain